MGGRKWKNVNRNDYGTADDVTYPVVAATPNVRPELRFNCFNIDADTLVFEYQGIDSDYNAPIKHAAYGGHDAGTPGFLHMKFGGGGDNYKNVNMHDTPVTSVTITHVFPAANIVDNGSGGTQSWFYARSSDNDPASYQNMLDDNFAATPVREGWNQIPWTGCDYSTSVDPMNNNVTHGTHDIQITATGPNTLQIDDYSYDPDYNDAAKAAYYGAGHTAADDAYMHIFYFKATGTATEWVLLNGTTDAATGSVYGKMTDVAPAAGARRIIRTINTADMKTDGTGNFIWVYIDYLDNHWKVQNPPTYRENSGFVKVYFP